MLRGVIGVEFGVSGSLAYFGLVVVATAALVFTGKHLDRRLPDLH